MLQLRNRLDLCKEPLRSNRRCEIRTKHLDGDAPVVANVVCEVDGRHSADTQLALDAVPARERGGEMTDMIR